MLDVKIKKLSPNAIIPTCGSTKSAGYDLYACIDNNEPIVIEPGTNAKISVGFAMTPPKGYYGAIVPRSGMATKRGLRPANTPGTVDEDYTGPVMVALYNDSDEQQLVYNGDRIAQMIFLPYLQVIFTEVDSLEETERGDGGFGSTGSR